MSQDGWVSLGELQSTSANLMVGHLQGDLDTMLAKSWRMRLALRLGRWTIAARQVVRDIVGGIRRIATDIDSGIFNARWP